MRITRAKRKPPAFCREVRTGFCGLFGKITAFSAKMILKRTVLWYTFCAKPLILVDRIVTLRCRSPCGERGLKCFWSANRPPERCRSPCGERGLKLRDSAEIGARIMSLPVRGAWVEICATPQRSAHASSSLPVRGAWVEITPARVGASRTRCRSPCGERGLK